uniref:Uncharacterized protein n=1 Tax=Stomoxys calcitrans TaxID=35570 RepID=A0A1I8PJE9_STOCA
MVILFSIATIVLMVIGKGISYPMLLKQPSMDFIEAEVQYTTSQAEKTAILIRNVLHRLPQSPQYEIHRSALKQLLQNANDFQKPGPCHDKMSTFSKSWTSVMVAYLRPNSAPEYREILKLLEEYGLKDMMVEAKIFLAGIVSGRIGVPVEEGSAAYSEFLKMQC